MRKTSFENNAGRLVNLDRLIFLVDGVFAITMTLLVLELKPSDLVGATLRTDLLEILPKLSIYLIAFYTVANHWVVHQRIFRHITYANQRILWLTILGLLFITLIPVTTDLIGRYPDEKLAGLCFSINSFLLSLVNFFLWHYVSKHRDEFTTESDGQMLTITAQIWLLISLGWLISIAILFMNQYVAYISWVLFPNLAKLWSGKKSRRSTPIHSDNDDQV